MAHSFGDFIVYPLVLLVHSLVLVSGTPIANKQEKAEDYGGNERSLRCSEPVELELLQRCSRVDVDDVLLFRAIVEEVLGALGHFRLLFRFLREIAHSRLRLRVRGCTGSPRMKSVLVIAIARAVHSFEFVCACRCSVLRNDGRLQDEVVFLLHTLDVKHLEGHEDEAKDE